MKDCIRKKRRDGSGAVMIVEAAVVFPIMFFVVFLMLMLGGALLQLSRTERIVAEAAIRAAALCGDPFLAAVEENAEVPSSPMGEGAVRIRPYRYLFHGHARALCDGVAEEAAEAVSALDSPLFRGLAPEILSPVRIEPRIGLFASTVTARCEIGVRLPVFPMLSREATVLRRQIVRREPVGDAPEFLRNVSLAEDGIERSESLTGALSEVRDVLERIAGILN